VTLLLTDNIKNSSSLFRQVPAFPFLSRYKQILLHNFLFGRDNFCVQSRFPLNQVLFYNDYSGWIRDEYVAFYKVLLLYPLRPSEDR
jgi:hypothetical protein